MTHPIAGMAVPIISSREVAAGLDVPGLAQDAGQACDLLKALCPEGTSSEELTLGKMHQTLLFQQNCGHFRT